MVPIGQVGHIIHILGMLYCDKPNRSVTTRCHKFKGANRGVAIGGAEVVVALEPPETQKVPLPNMSKPVL